MSLPELNARVNELMKQAVKSDEVINLFSDIQEEFSLFDPRFLEEVSKMKEKNLAVELLKRLIAEQVRIYRRTNVVKSEKFSELIQSVMNRYLNGMLTNEEVIQELLNLARQIQTATEEGKRLGLTADELAFYDALTKPRAINENRSLSPSRKSLPTPYAETGLSRLDRCRRIWNDIRSQIKKSLSAVHPGRRFNRSFNAASHSCVHTRACLS